MESRGRTHFIFVAAPDSLEENRAFLAQSGVPALTKPVALEDLRSVVEQRINNYAEPAHTWGTRKGPSRDPDGDQEARRQRVTPDNGEEAGAGEELVGERLATASTRSSAGFAGATCSLGGGSEG